MKQLVTILIFSLILGIGLQGQKGFASIGNPDPVTMSQPDGTTFKAYIRGDEHYGWYETLDGFVFCKNPKDGSWEYAAGKTKSGRLTPSGQRVGRDTPPAIAKRIRPDHRDPHGIWEEKTPGKRATWDPRPQAGVRNVLIIQVAFADQPFTTPMETWEDVTFADGDDAKSVVTFYRENSYGKTEIRPVTTQQPGYPNGIVRATLTRNHPNYGRGEDFDSLLEQNDAETEWINEALAAIDPFVDFTAYDTNNNNQLSVDELNVYFIVAGYDASITSLEPNIWAHAWSAFRASGIRGDGLRLANWAMSGELHSPNNANPFGVIVHELGHSIFGLPDLYDTAGNNRGLGMYSVMAIGSFGRLNQETRNGMTPAPMDPWCRYFLGWAEPRTFSNAQIATFPSGLSAPDAPVLLPIEGSEEFFVVENYSPNSIWHEGIRGLLEQPFVEVSDANQAYASSPLVFTPPGEVTGTAVRCGIGRLGEFPTEVNGQIALIQRGEIPFVEKVINAKNAGAIGVIVFNNQTGLNGGTLGQAGDYVPCVTMAPEAEALSGTTVTIKINEYPWQGGLMVLHVDPTNSGLINDSDENDHQGVLIEEANGLFGSLLDNRTVGHVTHLFSSETNDRFADDTAPSAQTYAGEDSGVGLSQISSTGDVMTARITRDARLAYVVPWVVNNSQWSSRVAFYNGGKIAKSPLLIATTRDGQTRQVELPQVAPGAVQAFEAASLFEDLSGYSLQIYASESVFPSFLTFNLDAPSGGSPAQTTGMRSDQLSDRLIFSYLPGTEGGLAALVLSAPDSSEVVSTAINLSLHDANGTLIANREVTLSKNQPLATVLSDLFGIQVEEGAVIATAPAGVRLSGTTFAFNASLEPAMALPFPNESVTRYALPWIVSNNTWSSRIALFNQEAGPASVVMTATTSAGDRQQKTVTVPPMSLWAAESGDTFPGLSGYSLVLESDTPVFPNFLAFNLNAASGRSPAQTSGAPINKLNAELVFPYVPFEAGGVSALVLMAPQASDELTTPVMLSLHDSSGEILETVQVALTGKQPLAAVVADLFTTPPSATMTVTAAGPDEVVLAGTTFVFNGANEPSMSRAISP